MKITRILTSRYFVDAAIETLPSLIYVFANIYEIKRFLVSLKYCLRLKSRFSFIFQKKKFWHKDKLVVCDHEACNLCETTNTVKKFDLERFYYFLFELRILQNNHLTNLKVIPILRRTAFLEFSTSNVINYQIHNRIKLKLALNTAYLE